MPKSRGERQNTDSPDQSSLSSTVASVSDSLVGLSASSVTASESADTDVSDPHRSRWPQGHRRPAQVAPEGRKVRGTGAYPRRGSIGQPSPVRTLVPTGPHMEGAPSSWGGWPGRLPRRGGRPSGGPPVVPPGGCPVAPSNTVGHRCQLRWPRSMATRAKTAAAASSVTLTSSTTAVCGPQPGPAWVRGSGAEGDQVVR